VQHLARLIAHRAAFYHVGARKCRVDVLSMPAEHHGALIPKEALVRNTPARLSLALIAAMLCCLALVSPASATLLKGQSRDAYFKVTVKGVQTTNWTENHQPQFKCDYTSTGSGKEKVVFKSRKAVVIRAFQFMGKGPVLFVRGKGQADLPTRGYVERQGTRALAPASPECAVGDGDGSYTPPKPDCGRKTISSLPLRLAYDALNKNRITLSTYTSPKAPVFQQCPLSGIGWSTILSSDDHKRTAGQSLPVKDLYDRRQGKMIVLGKGAAVTNSGGTAATTKINWELTLTRLKKR
jgi:hypothetical protein